MRATIAAVLPLALFACSSAPADDGASSVEQPIVNGTPSTAAQDATVMLTEQGQLACTATLIAPNLILTARHCVSRVNETSECGPATTNYPVTGFAISMGVRANAGAPVARGKRLFVPTTGNLCGHDLALIQLDRNITTVKPVKVRFTPLAAGEITTTIGYGDNGRGQLTPGRYQRTGVKILAVGPASSTYRMRTGQNLQYTVPNGDIATGESTCFGDSGGPLLDAKGEIVGVTSRGVGDTSCIDAPSIFAGTVLEAQFIKDAAKAAGFPLDTTPPPAPAPTTQPGEEEEEGPTGAPSTTSTEEEEEEAEEAPTPPKKKKKPSSAPQASAGCNVGSPATSASPFALGIAALAVVFIRRRRNSGSASTRAPS